MRVPRPLNQQVQYKRKPSVPLPSPLMPIPSPYPSINSANEDRAFTVRHFAGDVAYQVDDFMQKNTETMETQTRQLLQGAEGLSFLKPILEVQRVVGAFAADGASAGLEVSSSSTTVSGLGMEAPAAAAAPATALHSSNKWQQAAVLGGLVSHGSSGDLQQASSGNSGGTSNVGRVATSTGKRFLRDMSRLMAQLQASSAHFVHCIKPNGLEQPELLSYEMVAEQLTSLGTLETVQLMGLGFPVRIKYDVVRRRYLPRLAAVEGSALLSPKLFAEMIMEVRA